MKIGSWLTFIVLLFLPLTIFACREASPIGGGPSSPTQDSTVNAPAVDLTGTTAAPVIQNPTATGGVQADNTPVASDLSEAEVLQIVRSSFSTYPWRMQQSVLVKATQQTSTTLTEAQSSTRGYNQSVQTVGTETITIESILIDSLLYLKITGSPAETYGLVDGQWAEVAPDSPLVQLANKGAIDPAKLAEIFATDFAAMSAGSGADEMLFEVVGSEDVNGIPTTLYESKGETFTYRWWIGADQRIYKTTVDLPVATRTILIEYDPTITVQSPIP